MRIDGFVQSQNLVKAAALADVFSRFNVGDVIRAKVLSIVADELLLKLFDGSEFTAKSDISEDIKRGDVLELLVNSKRDGQLFVEALKILNSDTQNTNKVKPPISNSPSEKETIEKMLLDNNLPAGKEVIDGIKKAVNLYKDLDVEKSIFLLKNNLELNESNINNLNALIEGKLQLGNDIGELLAITSALTDELSLTAAEISGSVSTDNTSSLNITGDIYSTNIDINTNKDINNDTKFISAENTNIFPADKSKEDIIFNSIFDDKLLEDIGDFIKPDDIKQVFRHLTDDINKNSYFNKTDTNQIHSKALEIINSRYILPERISKKAADIVTELVEKNNEILMNHKSLINEIKNEINKLIFNLDDNDTKDSGISKDIYENISDKIDNLKEIINSVMPDKREELNYRLDNIKNDINFLQELNKYSSYIQIPVSIFNNQRTGELYILKRKKGKKAIDKDNISVFISLNTVNLGQIDTLVNMKNNNISINMRVEDEKIIKVLKDNYKILYDSILETGYKLVNVKYMLKGEKINPVNIEKVIDKEFKSILSNIDYKI